jgi:hypothetical protein
MSTTLTLDAPGAAEALGRAYAILLEAAARRRARLAAHSETADDSDLGQGIVGGGDAPTSRQGHRDDFNINSPGAQAAE